jgi:hypothetical protein
MRDEWVWTVDGRKERRMIREMEGGNGKKYGDSERIDDERREREG